MQTTGLPFALKENAMKYTDIQNSIGFFKAVYKLVAQIPTGKVMTYGQIAFIIGRPGASRTVGYAMSSAPAGLPCHRVVNRLGEMAPGDIFGGAAEQRRMLEAEGISFLPNGRIDLKNNIWDGA